ncbi:MULTISPECIES: potassium channel protein [Providencia]|uniref:potassium channel protein n=1 Tax=Providencia TaxID=586 RepID=UPI00111F3142|nr:potassium channel protein [Providencia stuartii]
MGEWYSKLTYTLSAIGGFFSSSGFLGDFSVYEWGFLAGLVASISLGVMTYRLNRREQMKRTRILAKIARYSVNGKDVESIIKASVQSPKDL